MRKVRFGILLLLILFLLVGCRSKEEPPFSIVFFDVGQGSAVLMRTPDGDILVDCGPENAQETLCRKLKSRGVQAFRFLILTHPDEDHIGGADLILEQFPVEKVLYNGSKGENESFLRLWNVVEANQIPMMAPDESDKAILGELNITFFHPQNREDPGTGNNSSLVFCARYETASILFTGDADESVEKTLLETFGADQLSATVLQVGHHGAQTSSSGEFLAAVHPTYAVISCGAGNRYGHPDGRVLERLQKAGAEVIRTDLEGDITFQWYGETLERQQ